MLYCLFLVFFVLNVLYILLYLKDWMNFGIMLPHVHNLHSYPKFVRYG